MRGKSLDLIELTRRLGGRAVVDRVSLHLEPGELLALVGPSGCGKSTLLRVVAGLDRPDGGLVHLDGKDVTSRPAERRQVGLVFQDHGLFPHLNVADNIGFGLWRVGRAERRRWVAELLELVKLSHTAGRYPHELSGGEQQRVALARALAPEPGVVLLDEPFANLDASLRDELREDTLAVLRERGATAILVTHDRREALLTGDRVAVMREGALCQVSTPEEVYEHPVDGFVATFFGPASVLPGAAGTWVMARPHDLEVVPGGPDTVVARRYLGAVWRHEVRLADGSMVVADVHPDGPVDVSAPASVRVVAPHPLHVLADGSALRRTQRDPAMIAREER